MTKVTVIKFKSGGKLYYFAPKPGDEYKRNMPVIVETAKGIEYAWVAYPEKEIEDSEITPPLKKVVRIATEKDTEFYEACQEKKPEAMDICRKKIIELGLEMKLVDCEYAFDGSKITFFFTSPNRVDFRELVRALAATFRNRIELRQVGTRDETKYLGGIAPCGRVCCCAGNMPEFKKVSIKMAKNQGLSLNPGKISGLCGRLMCCLSYENDYYAEAFKNVPKIGAEASSADGTGTVVSVNMLKMTAKLRIADNAGNMAYRDYNVSDLRFKKPAQNAANDSEDTDDGNDENGAIGGNDTAAQGGFGGAQGSQGGAQGGQNAQSGAKNNKNFKKKNKNRGAGGNDGNRGGANGNGGNNGGNAGGEKPQEARKTEVFDSSSIFN